MVFDMRGNNMVNSKIKSLEVNYDKKATKEKIADHIQNIPFAISLDDSVLDALPNYMKHIPLKGIMLNAIKWNNEAKHVGGD